MAAIDSEKWDRAVSKVMKEAEQYLIYDGLLNVSEDVSMDTSTASIVDDIFEEDNFTVSEEDSSEESSTTPTVSAKKSQLQSLIVHQYTEESISPNKLAAMHGISANTVRNWIKRSGAQLPSPGPSQYKESVINDQPSASTSNTVILKQSKELITNLKSKWPSLTSEAEANVNSHKCSKCNFETSKKNSLDLHVKSIHVDCKQCGQVFVGSRAKGQLAGHLKKHHNQFPKQHLCELCNKEFKSKQNVTRHMETCPKMLVQRIS